LRILILSQFFYPEIGAPAARFYDFSQYFMERGHQVSVLTGFPNFPSGKIHAGYEGKRYMREEIDGIDVHRSYLYTSGKTGFRAKSMGYLSFMLSSAYNGTRRVDRPDVLLATAPPPTVGGAARYIARRHKIPLVYDLRDLWPEALVLGGRLKNRAIISSLERMNDRVYRQAEAITTVSEGKRIRLIECGVPAEKIQVIPNGVDLSYFDGAAQAEQQTTETMAREAGIPENAFTVTYAGIMNPPQGLSILLDAADVFAKEPGMGNVHFVLIGSGSMREELETRAAQQSNVTLLPEQPRVRIPAFLCRSSANVVPLRPRKDTHTVPSKIFEYMASGRPLLLSADSEPARIVEEAKGGLISSAGNLEGLLASIRQVHDNQTEAAEMGRNARAYVDQNYNRNDLNRRFLQLLEGLTSS
jgi:glycosyltransferase involved in cell wall biosynthesis